MAMILDTHGPESAPSYDPGLPPAYELSFLQLYEHWKASINAAKKLDTCEVEIAELEKELDSAMTVWKKLKDTSSVLFNALHARKNSVSSFLGLRSKTKVSEAERQEKSASFERAHSEETKQAILVEGLQEKLKQIKEARDILKIAAGTSDGLWHTLSENPGATRALPDSLAPEMGTVVEEATAAESAFIAASKRTADMIRARLTVQHAHKYFSTTLKYCDDLNPSSNAGRSVEGFGGSFVSIMKQNDYRNAKVQATKAQVCLDECLMVLEPYLELLPEERKTDYDSLKSLGISQIEKIYNLMYGSSNMNASIRKTLKILLDRQEAAFGHLTRLAVWVQDQVPKCESEGKVARWRRDDGRAKLAGYWVRSNS